MGGGWRVLCSAHFDRVVLEVTSGAEKQLPTKLVTRKEGLKEWRGKEELKVTMATECKPSMYTWFEYTTASRLTSPQANTNITPSAFSGCFSLGASILLALLRDAKWS